MKIYTIQRIDKIYYDFSVTTIKRGCFADKTEALKRAKEEFERLKNTFADEIEEYSNEEEYPDVVDGAFDMFECPEKGYYQFTFGFEEDFEIHTIEMEEWDVDSVLRDDLLVTAGSRVAYMDVSNTIVLPEGTDGEREISLVVSKAVDNYIDNNVDESYDIFIEDVINKEYGMEGI